jgi:hypothetical protein
MATLFQPDGIASTISPANGKTFALDELQHLVAGFIEFVPVNEQGWLVVNEDGRLKHLPENPKATQLFNHPICGVAVLCSVDEVDNSSTGH